MIRSVRPAVAVVAALALLAPAGALAQDPFSPLPPPQGPAPSPEPTPVPVDPEVVDDGLSAWQQVAILAAAVALLAGIGYAIVSDARRRAPAKDPVSASSADEQPGAPASRSKERRRERAKAARRQRRRNRAR